MLKLDRNYILQAVGRDGKEIIIQPPFTLEFDSNRTYRSGANTFSIRIYNLSKDTRNRLRKDVYLDYFRAVSLKAGYGKNLTEVIRGNIDHAWTVREGNNFILNIEGYDGGVASSNAAAYQTYVANTPQKSIITDLVSSLKSYGVTLGAIGNYEGDISRGNSYVGSTIYLLDQLTGGGFFIDNGVAHCLRDDEVLDDNILVINQDTGLLGTPLLEETIVNIETLFEPMVKIAQMVSLESVTDDRFNGIYKVTSIHHKVTISPIVSGHATTSLGLVSGAFTPVSKVE